MKKQILITIPYGMFLNVTPEVWLQLLECSLYSKKGTWNNPEYIINDAESLETTIVNPEELLITQEVVDMKETLEENNRLARLVSSLEDKLNALTPKTSDSKDIECSSN
jgi:hypothetical protein